MTENIRKWIGLTRVKGVGPVKARKLLEQYSIDEIVELYTKIGLLNLEGVDKIINDCEKLGIMITSLCDKNFPFRLKDIKNGPIVIYSLGDMALLNSLNTVGIVGARRCSRFGRDKSIELSKEYSKMGYTIISGMAKGVDSYAHTAALKNNGKTIAVLGNGPDICYPKEHIELMNSIKDSGLLISEYPPGTSPTRYSFVQRNRIIAGLSDKLCVIDAGRNSGTNSTADFAESYGVEVRKFHDNK